MRTYILILFFFSYNILALADSDENRSIPFNDENQITTQIDDYQKSLSNKVLVFSSNLDEWLTQYFEDNNTAHLEKDQNDTNHTTIYNLISKPVFKTEEDKATYETSNFLDSFFKNESYFDTTNQSYIRLRSGYVYDRKGEPFFHQNINARIRLPKTQEQLQLFFSDDQNDFFSSLDTTQKSVDEGIGIRYFLPILYGRLFSNASIGLSGIDNPYLKTHIEYPIFIDDWLFTIGQNFQYSFDHKFDEWTDLSFSKTVSENNLLRLLLQRSTNSEITGMEYLLRLSYRNTFNSGIGTSYYIGFNGRTTDIHSDAYEHEYMMKKGIYEYLSGFVWRQQLYKNYLYYQIEPIASFHEQYNYRFNYLVRFSIELYFGYQP